MLKESKRQISKDLYEDNLYIEGRLEQRSRQGNLHAQPVAKKHSFIYGFFAAMTGAVGYSVFVSYSQINIEYITPINNPQVSLSSVTPTQAEIELIVPSATKNSANVPIKATNETLVDIMTSVKDKQSLENKTLLAHQLLSEHSQEFTNTTGPLPQATDLLNKTRANMDAQKSKNTEASATPIGRKVHTPAHAASKLSSMDDAIYDVYTAKNLKTMASATDDAAIIKSYGELSNSKYSLAKLFGLSVRTIVIDPGHGGRDPGAIGKGGTYEKDIALEIGKLLYNRLKAHKKYNVLMTRSTDRSVSLRKRVEYANNNFADLFISIHVNYFPSEKVNFVETYYFGPTRDGKTAKLAERENANSHYVYAEFKDMIQKIGDTMKSQESKELAASVQSSLYEEIRKISTSSTNHGIKPAPFVVLLGLDAPSILTEVTSLNNQAEEKRLNSPAYRDKIAKFLEKGIVSYLNKKATLGEKGNGHKEKEKLTQTKAETH